MLLKFLFKVPIDPKLPQMINQSTPNNLEIHVKLAYDTAHFFCQ